MRPGQSNKRMRGRPNGRNKGPNPLTRSYESSGPDVKIRGTAQHIGEKYLQLARDAQASGDPVMAESYLQHAEHYFRLIASAQQVQQLAVGYQNQPADPAIDDAEDEADFGGMPDRFASPLDRLSSPPQPSFLPQLQSTAAQSVPERPAQGSGDRQGFTRPERAPRPERPFHDRNFRDRDFQPPHEKPYPEHRGFSERDGRSRDQENRGSQGSRGTREYRSEASLRTEQRSDLQFSGPEVESNRLPAFITAPVRLAAEAGDSTAAADLPLQADPPDISATPSTFYPRPRRKRGAKAETEIAGFEGSANDNGSESSRG
jgi:hypothetical protein